MVLLKKDSKGEAVKKLQKALNKLGYNLSVDGDFGPSCYKAVIDFQKKHNLDIDGLVGDATMGAIEKASEPQTVTPENITTERIDGDELISRDQLKSIVRHASSSRIDLYFHSLNKAMKDYNIDTPIRIAHFLAQLAHESGSFRYNEELASGAAYENRADLGNNQPGDGVRFKGRGLIQLTGRANYEQYGRYIDRNLTDGENMKQVSEPELATDVAAWFWKTRKLNALADQDDVRRITRKINGGYNGLDDRMKYLGWAKEALNIT